MGLEVVAALQSHRAALGDPVTAELTAARIARVLRQVSSQFPRCRLCAAEPAGLPSKALCRRTGLERNALLHLRPDVEPSSVLYTTLQVPPFRMSSRMNVVCLRLTPPPDASQQPQAAKALSQRFPKSLDDPPQADVASLAGLFAALRSAGEFTRRRLTTTLEEENGRKAQFDLAVDRERKAAKELQTLERQLASERKDRTAVVASLTAAEARARRDLAQATDSHATATADLRQRKAEGDEAAGAGFRARHAALQAEVARLRTELEASSRAHREEETSWRKKRTKAEQEVANWLSEYDKDMTSREVVLDKERAAFAELSGKLASTLQQANALKEARIPHEKGEQERLRALFARAQKERIAERAAKAIQTAWKTHQATRPKSAPMVEEEKKEKKK